MIMDESMYFGVHIGDRAIYARVWALIKCTLFLKMFQHVMTETISGICEIDITEFGDYTDVDTFSFIFFNLHKTNFENNLELDLDSWKKILFTADFLGCREAKNAVEAFLLRDGVIDSSNCVDIAEFVNPLCNWGIQKVYLKAVNVIKGCIHGIISSGKFVSLSSTTLEAIFRDPHMTYLTMEERYELLTTWANKNKCECEDVSELFDLIDLDQLPLKCVRNISSGSWRTLRESDIDGRLRRPKSYKATKPVLVVAGGTGYHYLCSILSSEYRPMTPSSTLFAFDFVDEYWTQLPNIPVPMVSPLVAGNGKDCLYVLDSYGMNLPMNTLFCLEATGHSWLWRSIQVTMPKVLDQVNIFAMYCVQGSLYLLARSMIYNEVQQQWSRGPRVRQRLHDQCRSNSKVKHGAIMILKVGLPSGSCDVAAFLFVAYGGKETVFSCVASDKICVFTKKARPFHFPVYYDGGDMFAVYDCVKGAVTHNNHVTGRTPKPLSHLMPTSNQDGVMTVAMLGTSSRCFDFATSQWRDADFCISWPHDESCEDFLVNYSLVTRRGLFYFLGGFSQETKSGVPLFTCYNRGDGNLPVKGHERATWRKLPQFPVQVFHCGTTVTRLPRGSVRHHSQCPHCLLHPYDITSANKDNVSVPKNLMGLLESSCRHF